MFDHDTLALLQQSLPALPQLAMESRLTHDIDDLAAQALGGLTCAVVDDKFTAHAYGDRVFRALKGRLRATHVTLPGTPDADEDTIAALRRYTADCGALAAVGSGTVSDLCKYASFLDSKPYIVFPTAASMNGYASANASISEGGLKKTLAAHLPLGIFCDKSVIANAPARLSKAGLGDSVARPTAQADWLLSHHLLGTAYDDLPFRLLAAYETPLFAQSRGIALRDPATSELLMKLLLLSGFGMTIAGGSYPASQGEHMIAHALHMLLPEKPGEPAPLPTLHGEDIAVTTLIMARRQQSLLRARPALQPLVFAEQALTTRIGAQAAKEAAPLFERKRQALLQQGLLEQRLAHWESMVDPIEKIRLSEEALQRILEQAEAPVAPEMLSWREVDIDFAARHARFLRERFTFLDLRKS